jgi:hypothetical protein
MNHPPMGSMMIDLAYPARLAEIILVLAVVATELKLGDVKRHVFTADLIDAIMPDFTGAARICYIGCGKSTPQIGAITPDSTMAAAYP